MKKLNDNFAMEICIGFLAQNAYKMVDSYKESTFSISKNTLIFLLEELNRFYKEYNKMLQLNERPKIQTKVVDHKNLVFLHSKLLNEIKKLDIDSIDNSTLKSIIFENYSKSKNNLLDSTTDSRILMEKQLWEIEKTLNYII